MKWTYSIKNKLTAAILLFVILGITLLTNYLERKRFEELNQSMTSIYEDRLLVESYIFHLYKNLRDHQDFWQADIEATEPQNIALIVSAFQARRDSLMENYAETYLTEEEGELFDELTWTFVDMKRLETELLSAYGTNAEFYSQMNFPIYNGKIHNAIQTLLALSEIQTTEGEILQKKSRKIALGSVTISYLEMSILVVIALIIQALVFSSYTLMVGKRNMGNLN